MNSFWLKHLLVAARRFKSPPRARLSIVTCACPWLSQLPIFFQPINKKNQSLHHRNNSRNRNHLAQQYIMQVWIIGFHDFFLTFRLVFLGDFQGREVYNLRNVWSFWLDSEAMSDPTRKASFFLPGKNGAKRPRNLGETICIRFWRWPHVFSQICGGRKSTKHNDRRCKHL